LEQFLHEAGDAEEIVEEVPTGTDWVGADDIRTRVASPANCIVSSARREKQQSDGESREAWNKSLHELWRTSRMEKCGFSESFVRWWS
jgi:hypothetical protein